MMPIKKPQKIEDPKNYIPIGSLCDKAQNKKLEVVELRELQEEFNKDYMHELIKSALIGKKRYPNRDRLFLVVLMKRERLINKVLRNYFAARVTCPTPAYDQMVYKFNTRTEEISFLWVIPDKNACARIYSQKYAYNKPYSKLMPYVVDFMEGKLHRKEQEFNKDVYNRRRAE